MLYNKQNNKVSNIKKIVYYKNTFRNNAMRIGVNTRLFLQNKLDGIGWFGVETMKRITRTHPEHEFFFFFDRKPDQEFIFSSNVKPIVLIPQARHPILWYLFFEHSITYALKKYKIDLFYTIYNCSVTSSHLNKSKCISFLCLNRMRNRINAHHLFTPI